MSTKHIADPVHGAIDLHPWEFEVIDTPSFQRLRRIKQLAMASQVYPGADHSRFVHSLGVFAIMSRLVQRLHDLNRQTVTDDDVKKLRLAALLHDVGHYPYSHLMEKLKLPEATGPGPAEEIRAKSEGGSGGQTPGTFLKHEELGEVIVNKRTDIASALTAHGFDPAEIGSIFCDRHGKSFYNQLLSKGLDVDRLDYMLRDAHYTGVPYGGIDIEYILRNIRFDKIQNVCITPKAILSTEHFLLSRWYNYGGVVFQKTVMAMEALVRELLQRMVTSGALPNSRDAINQIVSSEHDFLTFDDHYVDAEIRRIAEKATPNGAVDCDAADADSYLAYAVLHRVKPRCVYEGIQEPGNDARPSEELRLFDEHMSDAIARQAKASGIPPEFWLKADSTPRYLEGAKPYGSFTDELEDRDDTTNSRSRSISKLVRVLQPDESSEFLVDRPSSLLRPLARATFRVARVFVLFPDEVRGVMAPPGKAGWRRKFKRQAEDIRRQMRADLKLG